MQRTDLPDPIREVLRDQADEARVQRLWRGVGLRRATGAPRRFDWRYGPPLALAAAVLLAIGAYSFVRTPAPGPLRTAGGDQLDDVYAAGRAERTVALSDGSRIRLRRESRLEVLDNGGERFVLLLAGGGTEIDVTPGGPRRWTIECGLATVEVVGTGLVIEREPQELRVRVTHGRVLVRGERVPERVRLLAAGDAIVVVAGDPVAMSAPAPSPADPTAVIDSPGVDDSAGQGDDAIAVPGGGDTATRDEARGGRGAAPAAWRDAAARGDYREAYRLLGREELRAAVVQASAEDLFRLADVARLSGHPADAVVPLRRLVEEYPGDPNAAVAAFTLGRVELHHLGHPARAAEAFERALALGLPAGLVPDAIARLADARHRAGDAVSAAAAARRYLAAYPTGRDAAGMRSLVGDDPPPTDPAPTDPGPAGNPTP